MHGGGAFDSLRGDLKGPRHRAGVVDEDVDRWEFVQFLCRATNAVEITQVSDNHRHVAISGRPHNLRADRGSQFAISYQHDHFRTQSGERWRALESEARRRAGDDAHSAANGLWVNGGPVEQATAQYRADARKASHDRVLKERVHATARGVSHSHVDSGGFRAASRVPGRRVGEREDRAAGWRGPPRP